jgi:hypothetical protein
MIEMEIDDMAGVYRMLYLRRQELPPKSKIGKGRDG